MDDQNNLLLKSCKTFPRSTQTADDEFASDEEEKTSDNVPSSTIKDIFTV